MALAEGYCSYEYFQRIPLPRPVVLFDGEDMTGKEVVAISLSLGLLVKNELRRMPNGLYASHLCECESGNVAVELWEGPVSFKQRPFTMWEQTQAR